MGYTKKNKSLQVRKSRKSRQSRQSRRSRRSRKLRQSHKSRQVRKSRKSRKIKNKKLIGSGNISLLSSKPATPFFRNSSQPVIRINDYVCIKDKTLEDISNVLYELFVRRLTSKSKLRELNRAWDLDMKNYFGLKNEFN